VLHWWPRSRPPEEQRRLLPETDLDGARLVGDRILHAVQELAIPHPASPVASHVTVSGGISESNLESDGDAHVLISRADEALYRAKARGRARIETSERRDKAGSGA
jgi:diguanylate cyclase (GGDEF)-like protein